MNIKKVDELMRDKNISQVTLSAEIGISKTGLNQILLGNNIPKVETLEKIAKFFNVPIGYFFDETENSVSTKKPPDNTINELVKQNSALIKQVSDLIIMQSNLINMQALNAESIRNLSGGNERKNSSARH